jgi:hypothetical protein
MYRRLLVNDDFDSKVCTMAPSLATFLRFAQHVETKDAEAARAIAARAAAADAKTLVPKKIRFSTLVRKKEKEDRGNVSALASPTKRQEFKIATAKEGFDHVVGEFVLHAHELLPSDKPCGVLICGAVKDYYVQASEEVDAVIVVLLLDRENVDSKQMTFYNTKKLDTPMIEKVCEQLYRFNANLEAESASDNDDE